MYLPVLGQIELQDRWTLVAVFLGTIVLLAVKSWYSSSDREVPLDILNMAIPCGDITLEELSKYDGRDPFRPIYIAVKGQVYDMTKGRDFYGPGGSYQVFAGKEVARALGKMSTEATDCNGNISDLSRREQEILQDWDSKFQAKYQVAGKVVPAKELTLDQLQQFDGNVSGNPMYLAIRGVIFDVSKGEEFYGPEGIYPFAGRECARAFALYSTNIEDCNAHLEGLDKMALDSLTEWELKFHSKYPVVGHVAGLSAAAD